MNLQNLNWTIEVFYNHVRFIYKAMYVQYDGKLKAVAHGTNVTEYLTPDESSWFIAQALMALDNHHTENFNKMRNLMKDAVK